MGSRARLEQQNQGIFVASYVKRTKIAATILKEQQSMKPPNKQKHALKTILDQPLMNSSDNFELLDKRIDASSQQITELASSTSTTNPFMTPYIQSFIGKIPPRIRGLALANALVVLVATNWVVVKDVGTTFDPFLFAALRFSIAAAALSPFILKAARQPQTLKAGIELGIYTALGYLSQSEGLVTTDASRASFLSTFTVLVVPFLAGMSGRGVQPLTWAASATALVGVALLEQSGTPPCIGDFWSIVSAVAFGVQIFRTEHWSRVLGRQETVPLMSVVLSTTALVATFAAVASHPGDLGAVMNPFALGSADVSLNIPWGQVLYTGLLTTDVALLMEVTALRDVSSMDCAVTYTMEPVLGAGFAFAMLGERWEGLSGWLGAGLIIASCLGMQMFGEEGGSDDGEEDVVMVMELNVGKEQDGVDG